MRLIFRGDPAETDLRRESVRRHLHFSLSRFAPRIDRVSVTLRDVNGPRGGLDKACRVVVHLPGLEPVIIEAAGTDFLQAAAEAAERAGRSVARSLERHRERVA